jgi:antibiotic biosynthesis monooxygenase (ABM) superfamily enzyme
VKVEPVKIVIERRVRAGAESAFKDWSHRWSLDFAQRPLAVAR